MTMPTDPGAQVAGRLEIPVVADLEGFREQLIRGVEKASKGVEATVGVKLDTAGLRKRLESAVEKASAGVNAQVGVRLDTKGLRKRLQGAVDKAAAGVTASVGVRVDDTGLRARFEKAAEDAARGVSARVKVLVDEDHARASLRDAFGRERVRVLIDEDRLRGDVARILDSAGGRAGGGSGGAGGAGGDGGAGGASGGDGAGVVPDRVGFIKRFRAMRAQAKAEAAADPINVPFQVDPKSAPRFRTVLRGAVIGSVISLIQPAIAAIGGLIIPLTGLVSSIGQAAGSLGALPTVFGAVVVGAAAGIIGFKGMGDALGALSAAADTAGKDAEELAADQEALNAALGKLPKPMQDVAKELFAVGQAFKPVREAVQEALFEKLAGHIEAPLKRALPVLQKGLEGAATQVGLFIRDLAHLAGSEKFLRPLGKFFESTEEILSDLRRAFTPLASAAMIFLAAAGPAAERVAEAFKDWAIRFEGVVQGAADSGAINEFLQDAIDLTARWWEVAKDTIGGLVGILKGSSDAGDTLLTSIEKNMEKFNEWANSLDGQNSIKAYMDDLLPVFYSMVGLIGDIGEALGRMARDPDTAKMIEQIRDELVPALESFLDTLGDTLGPAIIDAISSIVTTLENLGEAGGGIAIAVQMIDLFFDTINDFFEAHPTAANTIGQIVGAVAGFAILQTGLALFLKPFRGLLGVVTGFGGKAGLAGIGALKTFFGLTAPSWLGGGGGGKPGVDGMDPKDAKNVSKTIQRVTWGPKPLPVVIIGGGGGPGGPTGVVPGGPDGPDGKPGTPAAKPGGILSKVGGVAKGVVAGALVAGAVATGIGRRRVTRAPLVGGGAAGAAARTAQAAAKRQAASKAGAQILSKGSASSLALFGRALKSGGSTALSRLGTGLKTGARFLGGKGGIAGIAASVLAYPVANKIKGDGSSRARNVAGGALSGAATGAGFGALAGSVIGPVGAGLGGAIGGAAGAIIGGLNEAFPDMSSKVKNAAGAIGGVAAAAIGVVGRKTKPFSWIAKQAGEAVPVVGRAISGVGGAIGGALSGAGRIAGGAMSSVVGAVKNGLLPAVASAGSRAKEAVGALGSGLATAGGKAADAFGSVTGAARTKLGEAAGAVKTGALSAADNVRDGLGKAKDYASTKFGEVTGAAKTKLGETLTAARTKADEIAGGVRDNVGKAKGYVTTKWDEVKGATGTKLTELREAAKKKATEAAEGFRDNVGKAKGYTQTKWEEAKSATSTKLTELRDGAKAKATEIADGFRDKLGSAKGHAQSKWEEVKGASGTKLTELREGVRAKATEVANAFSTAVGATKDFATTKFSAAKIEAERVVRALVSSVGEVLTGLQEKFAVPVRWVGNKVLAGLRTVFNGISGLVNGPQIPPISLGFAKGGVVPGYAPGRDTELARVSPGEGWLVPEAVRGLAAQMGTSREKAIQTINAQFSGRVRAPQGFSKGGVTRGDDGLQRFHLGGLAHNAEHARNAVGWAVDKGKSALNQVGDGIAYVGGKIKGVVAGGLRKAFDKAMGGIAALRDQTGSTKVAELGKATVNKTVGSLGAWLSGKDQEQPAGSSPNGTRGMGPRALAASAAVRRLFDFRGVIGGYANRNIGGTNKLSKHALGKAIDVMTNSNMALGQRIADYFVQNRGQYGVDNVIFNRRITNAGRGWKYGRYTGQNPHLDHPHIDFLAKGGQVQPRPGGTLAMLAEAGKAETVVDSGLMNRLMEQVLAGRTPVGGGAADVRFEEGAVVIHNPAPEPASQSVQASLRRVSAFGMFG